MSSREIGRGYGAAAIVSRSLCFQQSLGEGRPIGEFKRAAEHSVARHNSFQPQQVDTKRATMRNCLLMMAHRQRRNVVATRGKRCSPNAERQESRH